MYGASIGAQRAYFRLSGLSASDLPQQVRAFVLNFDDEVITSMMNVQRPAFNVQSDNWYSLDCRRLSYKPTQKGIYIMGKRWSSNKVGVRSVNG